MSTILIVDDEENIRLLFSAELEDEGYNIIAVGSGEEALKALEEREVDLVTLDLKLLKSGMTGVEALYKFKETHRDIPVIIVTAYGTMKEDFSMWAADDYITKSSDLTELKDAIKKHLGGSDT